MPKPKAAAVVDDLAVTIPTTKPPEGSRRIVLAIVDDAGQVKQHTWEMTAPQFRHLPERYSWELYFYPALNKMMV